MRIYSPSRKKSFQAVVRNGSGGNLPGCLVPAAEATADKGFSGAIFRELFQQTLGDSAVNGFDNHLVQENTVTPGTNSCRWINSGLAENPGVYGSHWTVGQYNGVPGYHDQWGLDGPISAIWCRSLCSRTGLLQGDIRDSESRGQSLHRL